MKQWSKKTKTRDRIHQQSWKLNEFAAKTKQIAIALIHAIKISHHQQLLDYLYIIVGAAFLLLQWKQQKYCYVVAKSGSNVMKSNARKQSAAIEALAPLLSWWTSVVVAFLADRECSVVTMKPTFSRFRFYFYIYNYSTVYFYAAEVVYFLLLLCFLCPAPWALKLRIY